MYSPTRPKTLDELYDLAYEVDSPQSAQELMEEIGVRVKFLRNRVVAQLGSIEEFKKLTNRGHFHMYVESVNLLTEAEIALVNSSDEIIALLRLTRATLARGGYLDSDTWEVMKGLVDLLRVLKIETRFDLDEVLSSSTFVGGGGGSASQATSLAA